jgi:prepilin-type processing-associated H-X9-DG protein
VFAGSGQGACCVSVVDLSIDAVSVSREFSVLFADGHVFMSVSITFTLQWYFIYEVHLGGKYQNCCVLGCDAVQC